MDIYTLILKFIQWWRCPMTYKTKNNILYFQSTTLVSEFEILEKAFKGVEFLLTVLCPLRLCAPNNNWRIVHSSSIPPPPSIVSHEVTILQIIIIIIINDYKYKCTMWRHLYNVHFIITYYYIVMVYNPKSIFFCIFYYIKKYY